MAVDRDGAFRRRHVTAEVKRTGELWRVSRLRQCKYLTNIVERDRKRIKRLVRPGLGFGRFRTARRTLGGFEAMAMIRKRQVHHIGGGDSRAPVAFVLGRFEVAA